MLTPACALGARYPHYVVLALHSAILHVCNFTPRKVSMPYMPAYLPLCCVATRRLTVEHPWGHLAARLEHGENAVMHACGETAV